MEFVEAARRGRWEDAVRLAADLPFRTIELAFEFDTFERDWAKFLTHYVLVFPDSRDAWWSLATVRRKLGDRKDAESAWARVSEIGPPDHIQAARAGRWEDAVRLAAGLPFRTIEVAFDLEGDPHPAAEFLTRYVRVYPDSADAWWDLARACEKLGRLNDAERAWTRVIEISPLEHMHHVTRADVRRKLGDYSGAADDWRRAMELDKEIPLSWASECAEDLARIGHYDRALEVCKIIAAQEGRLSPWEEMTNVCLPPEQEIALAGWVLAREPRCAHAFVLRAQALDELGRTSEAREDARRAVELAPALAEGCAPFLG